MKKENQSDRRIGGTEPRNPIVDLGPSVSWVPVTRAENYAKET